MFTHTGEKPYKRRIVIGVANISATVLKMHKFCHSALVPQKCDMFTYANIVKHVENIFLKPLP